MYAGHKVLMKVDDNILLIFGDLHGILEKHFRPHPIRLENIINYLKTTKTSSHPKSEMVSQLLNGRSQFEKSQQLLDHQKFLLHRGTWWSYPYLRALHFNSVPYQKLDTYGSLDDYFPTIGV
jgi:hypothetical protein